MKIQELAKHLLQIAGDRNPHGIVLGPQVKVGFNMQGYPYWYRDHGYPDHPLEQLVPIAIPDPEAQLKYWAHHHLWTSGALPSYWLDAIQTATQRRTEMGLFDALDVFYSCKLAAQHHKSAQRVLVSKGMISNGDLMVDETATKELFKFMDLFMSNKTLTRLFLKYALTASHYTSPVDYYWLSTIMNIQKQLGEDVIDMGCGDGSNILSIEEYLSGKIYAYDMQNLPLVFRDWNTKNSKVMFKVIDPKRIPNPDSSVGVVILGGVIGHWLEDAVIHLLQECERVLKPGGIIYVAPVNNLTRMYNSDPSLTFAGYQKDTDGFTQVWP